MPTGQQYATNVPQTTLTGSINASATSLSVASSSGWPATPFTACLDIGTSTQEPVDVTAVVGTTWTVTRNIDGTTGFSHAIGATVTHADIGRDFREARTHMDASTNVHGLSGGAAVVGDISTQTLTNKTLTAPAITGSTAISGATTSGLVSVTNTASVATPAADLLFIESSGTSNVIGSRFAADTNLRLAINTGGQINWGPGNITPDIQLARVQTGVHGLFGASFAISDLGFGLQVKEGANCKQGTVSLVGGTATVSNTAAKSTSRIFLTSQQDGGAPGFLRVSSRVAGTSFVITSSSGTDTSTVAYEIIDPA